MRLAPWFFGFAVGSVLFCSASFPCIAQSGSTSIGALEAQTDVGAVSPPGSATYSAANDVYTVKAAGANMWSTTDAFHFAWKKMSGDVALTASITFVGSEGSPDPHRKAVLIF